MQKRIGFPITFCLVMLFFISCPRNKSEGLNTGTPGDITNNPGDITLSGAAEKGTATFNGSGETWTLSPITVNSQGLAVVIVNKDGVSNASQNVTVYKGGNTVAETVYVYNSSGRPVEEILLVQAMQGIVNRDKPQVYITGLGDSYDLWLDESKEKYGFQTVNATYSQLFTAFRSNFNGTVLYASVDTESLNYAATLAGVLDALPVSTPTYRNYLENTQGLPRLANASDYTSVSQIITAYGDTLNKNIYLNQPLDEGCNRAARDYGIKHKCLMAYPNSSGLTAVYNFLNDNALLMGWYNSEVSGVRASSQQRVVTIPADYVYNLSFFESASTEVHNQKEFSDHGLEAEPDKHYIAFVYSDGDNIQWILGWDGAISPTRFSYPDKTIPMGWSLAPTLSKFAPIVLNWMYKTAVPTDNYVAGVSGYGYIHPSQYNNVTALNAFGALTAEYMRRSGMYYTEILDETGPNEITPTTATLNAYTRNSQIKGIMYKTGSRYVAGRGFLMWSNDKPVVAFRETLWTTPENPPLYDRNVSIYQMAYRISQYDKNPSSINGYSLINVHSWSHNYRSVEKMVTWLKEHAPHVVVVTPDTFMTLIKENILPSTTTARPNKNWNDNWSYPSSVTSQYNNPE